MENRSFGKLRTQEFRVSELVVRGYSNSEIGSSLGIGQMRVRNILSEIYSKLNLNSNPVAYSPRARLVRTLMEERIVIVPLRRSVDFDIDREGSSTIYVSEPLNTGKIEKITLDKRLMNIWFLIYEGKSNDEIGKRLAFSKGYMEDVCTGLYQSLRNSGIMNDSLDRIGAIRTMYQLGLYALAGTWRI